MVFSQNWILIRIKSKYVCYDTVDEEEIRNAQRNYAGYVDQKSMFLLIKAPPETNVFPSNNIPCSLEIFYDKILFVCFISLALPIFSIDQ